MKSKQKAWLVLGAVYLAGLAVAVNEFKVPSTMQVLMTKLNVDMATGGWLMSSFAIVTGLLASTLLQRQQIASYTHRQPQAATL